LGRLQQEPANWPMQLGNYSGWRYTPLHQINQTNVKHLKIGWQVSAGVLRGHEGGPLVIDGVLYFPILWNKLPIAKIVNVKVINLEQAPEGYKSFDAGVTNNFVIDPHGQLSKAA
jgi:hypothetical protein